MRRRLSALAVAAGCALAALALYALIHNARVQALDARILGHALASATPRSDHLARNIVATFNPYPYVLLVALLMLVAVLAGRARAAGLALVAIIGATLTAELLKQALVLPRQSPPEMYMPPGSWPSGHTAAAVGLALGLVLVSPPRLRPLAAVAGALFAIPVAVSLVLTGSHYPTDVLGGALVATGWFAFAAAGLPVSDSARAPRAAQERLPSRSRPARG